MYTEALEMCEQRTSLPKRLQHPCGESVPSNTALSHAWTLHTICKSHVGRCRPARMLQRLLHMGIGPLQWKCRIDENNANMHQHAEAVQAVALLHIFPKLLQVYATQLL